MAFYSSMVESLNPRYAIPSAILALESNVTREYLTQAANTTIQTVTPVATEVARHGTEPGFGALVALVGLSAVAFLVTRKH